MHRELSLMDLTLNLMQLRG